MEQLVCERIQNNLQRLKLNQMRQVLDTVVKNSEQENRSYLMFLDQLLEEEVAAKDKRRIQTAMKAAGITLAKSIEGYDFSFHPQLDKKAVMELFDLSFLARRENIIFLGPPGVGKTHLTQSLAIKACYYGYSVYFTTMDSLIEKLKAQTPQSRKKPYQKASLVVVDEVGYLPINRKEAHLFFQFISSKYERSSLILTSNKSFLDWQELFEDPVIATAILDRLLHHCKIVNIKGHSYRLKGRCLDNQSLQKQGGDTANDTEKVSVI